MNYPARWVKNDQYVEIETATSEQGNVLVVASNIPWALLPLEFRESEPGGNEFRCRAFHELVRSWAEQRGFLPSEA